MISRKFKFFVIDKSHSWLLNFHHRLLFTAVHVCFGRIVSTVEILRKWHWEARKINR